MTLVLFLLFLIVAGGGEAPVTLVLFLLFLIVALSLADPS